MVIREPYTPINLEYTDLASPGSSVPLTIARPSRKTVTS